MVLGCTRKLRSAHNTHTHAHAHTHISYIHARTHDSSTNFFLRSSRAAKFRARVALLTVQARRKYETSSSRVMGHPTRHYCTLASKRARQVRGNACALVERSGAASLEAGSLVLAAREMPPPNSVCIARSGFRKPQFSR